MELLGRYQPLFVIGRGGMGTIEVAAESSGAVVALKRMNPGVRDRRHADMFLREARLATLLNHENVVHAFAFGEQDGELLIAMEYVEGETLASLLSVASLPLDVATYVLAEMCEGLHAAHELKDVAGAPLGVVHRDVSPQNLMLSYAGQVKVLDFGVAKLESHQLTKTGEVKGKTAY
ncbi:MAG TPA: serine/threonine-protein kinase, partial [Polyangiaceae bacterium]|nr:serine/threonine-protein kinase [Polyangiaceae bacterium]